MIARYQSVIPALLFLCAACSGVKEDDLLREAIRSVKERYAPDRRLAVFDIEWRRSGSSLVIVGQVEDPSAKAEVLAALRHVTAREIVDSIRILPDPSLGDRQFGIVMVSVANMRSKPAQSAELATQVLMGMVVRLLKEEHGWYYVQSHDKYLAWLEDEALHRTNRAGVDAWADAEKVIVTDHYGVVRGKPSSDALGVSDLVVGCILKKVGSSGSWVQVELPDGTGGYVERKSVVEHDVWKATRRLTPDNVEKVAKEFLGVPYLWGGTSVKGMDCSGFTKMVFRLNGLELQRDANQQATMGEVVTVGQNFEGLQKGDLLFFGRKASPEQPERITHVGIYLANKEFIHSPGGARVRLNSFDPSAANFSEALTRSFVRARRLIPSTRVKEVS
jgi:hypothetical protein